MARDPIKFRCFQCQKLLGVSPTKAGATVACPKCGAALLAPMRRRKSIPRRCHRWRRSFQPIRHYQTMRQLLFQP